MRYQGLGGGHPRRRDEGIETGGWARPATHGTPLPLPPRPRPRRRTPKRRRPEPSARRSHRRTTATTTAALLTLALALLPTLAGPAAPAGAQPAARGESGSVQRPSAPHSHSGLPFAPPHAPGADTTRPGTPHGPSHTTDDSPTSGPVDGHGERPQDLPGTTPPHDWPAPALPTTPAEDPVPPEPGTAEDHGDGLDDGKPPGRSPATPPHAPWPGSGQPGQHPSDSGDPAEGHTAPAGRSISPSGAPSGGGVAGPTITGRGAEPPANGADAPGGRLGGHPASPPSQPQDQRPTAKPPKPGTSDRAATASEETAGAGHSTSGGPRPQGHGRLPAAPGTGLHPPAGDAHRFDGANAPSPEESTPEGEVTESSNEILPVLPLGAGIASIGLGLAFLALRMRRN